MQMDGAVAVLTLNAPARMNALSHEMLVALAEALDDMVLSDARSVVITGAGNAFCAGADLQSVDPNTDSLADLGATFDLYYRPLVDRLRDYPLPTVAAVNGVAAGFGMSLVMMCDLTVMADDSYMAAAFARIGLVPDGGWSYLVPRLIGKSRALEMALLAEGLPAKTAQDWGLVNRLVPANQALAEGMALAERLAEGPASLTGIRRLVWHGLDSTWDEQLDAEAEAQAEAGHTVDFGEGVTAFQAKRPPKFLGY